MKTILTTPLLTLICAAFLIWSCSDTGSGNTMIFKDNVRIIDEFPFEYALSAPDTVSTGVIGLSGFDIQDSLLIVSTRTKTDSWKILRIYDMALLGEFLNTGNGPDEFVSFVPSVSYADRIVENGCLNYLLTDINRRILHKFNVTRSLYSQQADISSMQNDIPPACFEYIFIDDSTCFYKQPAPDNTGFIRMLARNGESFEPEGHHLRPCQSRTMVRSRIHKFMVQPQQEYHSGDLIGAEQYQPLYTGRHMEKISVHRQA